MTLQANPDRFHLLVQAWLDEIITETEISELNQILLDHPGCLRRFAQEVNLQQLLCESGPMPLSLESKPGASSQPTGRLLSNLAPEGSRRWRLLTTASIAIVALLVFGWWGWKQQHRADGVLAEEASIASPQVAPDVVPVPAVGAGQHSDCLAEVESVSGAAAEHLLRGQMLKASDRVTFSAGRVCLKFLVGAMVELDGPADLELVNVLYAKLHRGRVTASISPQARGFTIATPHADVIDLGTRFGVNVEESGQADVVVFEGKVDLDYRRGLNERRGPLQRKSLHVGEAVHIDGYGTFHRIPVIREGASAPEWTTKVTAKNSALIASLSDNFRPGDRPIYYSIAPESFDEDVAAYVDRPYEWNSLPGVDFPEPLRGGDVVRMMNDLKFVLNLQVSMKLRSPASVYVLFDERVPAPAWLTRDFERTPMRIGVDEYDPNQLYTRSNHDSIQTLGSGPGQSVDQSFSIWVRHVHRPGEVILGNLAEPGSNSPAISTKNLSMYGVVVTPLAIEATASRQ